MKMNYIHELHIRKNYLMLFSTINLYFLNFHLNKICFYLHSGCRFLCCFKSSFVEYFIGQESQAYGLSFECVRATCRRIPCAYLNFFLHISHSYSAIVLLSLLSMISMPTSSLASIGWSFSSGGGWNTYAGDNDSYAGGGDLHIGSAAVDAWNVWKLRSLFRNVWAWVLYCCQQC